MIAGTNISEGTDLSLYRKLVLSGSIYWLLVPAGLRVEARLPSTAGSCWYDDDDDDDDGLLLSL